MKSNKTDNEIRQLGPHDVLLGRGTGPNESIGNIRFRESIRVIIERSGIRKDDGHAKADLTTLIVARIKAIGGKFVKKVNLGKASETATGPSLESVYEEVCDAVARAKVKQCFRHQLSRDMCSRSEKVVSLTRSTNPPCKGKQAWLPSSEAISTTLLSRFQQPTRSPARSPATFLSKILFLPSGAVPYQQGKGQSEDSLFSSLVDLQQRRSAPATSTTADSQPQAFMIKEHLSSFLLHRFHGLRDHVASTPGSSVLPAMLLQPQVARNVNKGIILKKLLENQERELARLREALIVTGNKQFLEEQGFPLVTQQQFLESPSGMLEALWVDEMDIHRSKFPSTNVSMLHGPSLVTPHFF
jgi:hypothetical protein